MTDISLELPESAEETAFLPIAQNIKHLVIGISSRIGLLSNTETASVNLVFNSTACDILNLNTDYFHTLGIAILSFEDDSNKESISDFITRNNHCASLKLRWDDRNGNHIEHDIIFIAARNIVRRRGKSSFVAENKIYRNLKSINALLLLQLKELSIDQNSHEWMFHFSNMGGVALKAAQIFSLRSDLITNAKMRNILKQATDDNEKRDLSEVKKILRKEFGNKKYKEFDETWWMFKAKSAGSIGQVHQLQHKKHADKQAILKVTFAKDVLHKWRKQWRLMSAFGSSKAIPILHSMWQTAAQLEDDFFGEVNFAREYKFTKTAHFIIDSDENREESAKNVKHAMKTFGWENDYLPCHIPNVEKLRIFTFYCSCIQSIHA